MLGYFLLCWLGVSSLANAQRLPDTVTPEHYSLWLAPDLERATFRGRETIDVRLRRPSREITLNAAEIQFRSVDITSNGRTQRARVTLDERLDTATLIVGQPIAAGPATLAIEYDGVLNDKLRGFYLSHANGRNYAVSQLEATDARRAFPSFDEPAYKSTFDISLMIDDGDTAISNGRQVSDVPGPEPRKHTVSFARTPKMSAYLVALLVGDFVCREGAAEDIPVRVCSTPDKRGLTGFALDAAVRQLLFYNRYFGIKYPFAKLDIVGVPDFAAGAMENTAAITFRERMLLADPDRASFAIRKNIASIIAHEIAHQWFGDLVTMTWWDDIWLNEGFATWMANKPLAEWRPDWHVELDEAQETLTAKSTDALRATRPVRMDVETPDEINEVFDAIAYQKGAAVLRMIEAYVGPDLFQKGIAAYLRKYAYANATADDFWNTLTAVTGKPVDRIMRSYIDQAGVPVVSIEARCVGDTTNVTLRQERFTTSQTNRVSSESPLWVIPVCVGSMGGAPQCEILDTRRRTLTLRGCSSRVVANAQSRGYFFSEYSPDDTRALARGALTALAPVERLTLLGDEWWIANAGRHDMSVFLDMAASLVGDETPAVADLIGARLAYVGQYLIDPSQRARFEEWIRATFTPALDALGIPGDPDDTDSRQARRASLLTLVGVTGNSQAMQRRARELALAYIRDPRAVPPTLASAVLHVAAASGDAMLYEQYLAQVQKTGQDADTYYRFVNALAAFREPALVRRTLEFAISPSVRTQDAGILIGSLFAEPAARETAWTLTRERWQTLAERLGVFQGIPSIVGALSHFCSTARAADITQFFAAHPTPSSARTLQQSIERIEACAAFRTRQSPALARWLMNAPA